jgi:hypothetical protein
VSKIHIHQGFGTGETGVKTLPNSLKEESQDLIATIDHPEKITTVDRG